MASNLSCIGLPIESEDDFLQLAELVYPSAEPISVKGGTYLRAANPSGAELWLQLNSDDEIIGMNPHFSGSARSSVGITATVERPDASELDGAYHAWANPQNGDPENGDYPFVFDLPDFFRGNHIKLPFCTSAQIAAFAREASCYDSPEDHADSQELDPKLASESFIPAGLFGPDGETTSPPTAHAIVAGSVLEAHERVNTWKGSMFYYCRIRSLGGEFDVVLDANETPALPKIGGVIAGSFWLSGRLLEVPDRKNLITRLFGQ